MTSIGSAFTLRACAVAIALSFGSAALADEAVPGDIKLREHGHGWALTNNKGMSLYTFSRDVEPGKSTCNQACAQQWPPLLVTSEAGVGGDWSIITRADGKKQWAYRDKPLYEFSNDQKADYAFGDGMNNTWYAAMRLIPMPPAFNIRRTKLGQTMVDPRRLTLYTSEADAAGKSKCDGGCTGTWRVAAAPWIAKFNDPDWSVIARKDGTKQWAFKGKPLYTFDRDVVPGDVYGNGIDGRRALVLEPPPPNPPWVTYQISDGGTLVADARGVTLYMLDAGRRARIPNGGIQRPQDWKPVVAKPEDQPIGNWGIVERDGIRQWTHKGLLVYTSVHDQVPGDLHGVRNTDAVWRTILRSGEIMDGTGF